MSRRITAKLLANEWKVNVEHCLYHHEGTWFHQLKKFPGALFDAGGYLVFSSKEEYRNCPSLRFGQDCGCPDGIHSISGYIPIGQREASDSKITTSGVRIKTTVMRIVRDTSLCRELKLLYEDSCQICDTVIELLDGTYSEAHHIKPLGEPHCGSDTRDNIIVVCPSCHARLDYFSIPLGDFSGCLHNISIENIDYHNREHELRKKLVEG